MMELRPAETSTTESATVKATTRPEPSQNNFGSLWQRALQSYERRTGLDPQNHPLTRDLASCGSVEDILELFDATMSEFKLFRVGDPKWEKLRHRYLKPAVHVVLVMNDALKELGDAFPGGNALFVALGALLTATNGVSKRYDAFVDLFEEMPFFLDTVRIQEANPRSWGLASRNIAVAIFVHLLDIFAIALKLMTTVFGGTVFTRMAHFGKSLIGETDMQDALKRLRRLTELQSRALVTETRVDAAEALEVTHTLLKKLLDMDLAYSTYFQDVIGILQDERRKANDERANATLGRLDRLDLADLSAQDRPGCLNETRVSLLTDLDTWSHDQYSSRIYWLNGLAGTGKSAIARSFGRQLAKDNILGGSFFCSREGIPALTNVKRIIPTLAATLALRYELYKDALLQVLQRCADMPNPSVWKLEVQVQTLLVEPFSLFECDIPRFVFLIDGLDETTGETIGDLLRELVAFSDRIPVKLFLASRPEWHIQQSLDFVEEFQLEDVDEAAARDDIYYYVIYRMQKIAKTFKSSHLPDDWPSGASVRALANLAGTLFIHAYTTTEYIGGGNPVKRLRDVLDIGRESESQTSPLDGLYQVYAFILSSVRGTGDEVRLTWRILSMLHTLRTTLCMNAMARLLGVEVYEMRIALRHLHAIMHVPEHDDYGSLSTSHASFEDFLLNSNRVPEQVSLSLENGQLDVFAGCIAVMASDDLHFNISGAQSSYHYALRNQLTTVPEHVRYACLQWVEHGIELSESMPSSEPALERLCTILHGLEDIWAPKFFFWLETCSVLESGHDIRAWVHAILSSNLAKLASPRLINLLQDSHQLLELIGRPYRESAPHAYLSTLPFLNPESLLAKDSSKFFSHLPICRLNKWDINTDIARSRHIQLSSDGTQMFSCSVDHIVCHWDAKTGKLLRCLRGLRKVELKSSISFSSDGYIVASRWDDHTIHIRQVDSGQLLRRLYVSPRDKIRSVQFVPNPSHLYVITFTEILAYDANSVDFTLVQRFALPQNMHTGLAVSPDGNYIAGGISGRSVCIWGRETGVYARQPLVCDMAVYPFETQIQKVAFSLDGTRVTAVNRDESVHVWDLETGKTTSVWTLDLEPWELIGDVAISDSSVAVLIRYSSTVYVYDAQTHLRILQPFSSAHDHSLMFTYDGSSIITRDIDIHGHIRVWDIEQHDERCQAVLHNSFNNFVLPSDDTGDWLRGPERELLLHIPHDYVTFLAHPPCSLRLGEGQLTIDWENAAHGTEWTKIYTGEL